MNTKYTKEILLDAVQHSYTVSEVLRRVGAPLTGTLHKHIKKRIAFFEIDTSHFRGVSSDIRPSGGRNIKPWEDILVLHTANQKKGRTSHLRRALIESGVPHVCLECGSPPSWRGKNLRLEIDHVNGNNWDDTRGNLRFLCPNCHSQTETYGYRPQKKLKTPKPHLARGKKPLTREEKKGVREKMILRYEETGRYTQVGEEFGMKSSTVHLILSGKSPTWL